MGLKIKDIRGMSKEELNIKLIDLRKEIMKLNTQVARGITIKSPGQIKQIKKTIAKILTILKTKEGTKTG